MSFPRAKLKRFNEVKGCTPSPADYNIELKEKPKACVISQSERFFDVKSPSIATFSEHGSVHSVPVFRTPTLPKKKKLVSTNSASKLPLRSKELFRTPIALDDDSEILREKIVECRNKDIYIQELTEQMEDLKITINDLQQQKAQLDADKIIAEERIDCLSKDYEATLENKKAEHEKLSNELLDQIVLVKFKLNQIFEDYEKLKYEAKKETQGFLANIQEFQAFLKEYVKTNDKEYEKKDQELKKLQDSLDASVAKNKQELNLKNDEIENLVRELKALEKSCVHLEKQHAMEMDRIKKDHQNEIHDIEFEMLKTITEMQKNIEEERKNTAEKLGLLEKSLRLEMNEMALTFAEEKAQILKDNQLKINHLQENFNEVQKLGDIQLEEKYKEIESSWKIKLENKEKESEAILKECQAISEYNIIQCELEKNEILQKLAAKNDSYQKLQQSYDDVYLSYKNLQSSFTNIQRELCKKIKELNESTSSLNKERQLSKNYVNQLLTEKRAYDVSIAHSQQTIEVLKRRLMDSDKDVEQLKDEIEACENKILEYEDKCNILTQTLQIAQASNEELENQHEAIVATTKMGVENIKSDFFTRIDAYKEAVEKQLMNLTDQLALRTEEYTEIVAHLHDQQVLNTQANLLISTAQVELERVENENTHLNHHIKSLEDENTALYDELETLRGEKYDWMKSKESLEIKNAELSELVEKSDEELDTLYKQVATLQEKSDYNYQHYEYYKAKVDEFESEINESTELRKKYIDQSGKYDELLQKYEALTKDVADKAQKIKEQESLIGPFKEQLEAYEFEKNSLLNEKTQIENDAKELGLRYASILGHQNTKQKIKHLIALKSKNEDLKKKNLDMESKMRSQAKLIEKLKNESADLKKNMRKFKLHPEDKENMASPNRSLNAIKIDSPGPLRERN